MCVASVAFVNVVLKKTFKYHVFWCCFQQVQAGARAVQETKRMTADDLSEIEQVICRVHGTYRLIYCV